MSLNVSSFTIPVGHSCNKTTTFISYRVYADMKHTSYRVYADMKHISCRVYADMKHISYMVYADMKHNSHRYQLRDLGRHETQQSQVSVTRFRQT